MSKVVITIEDDADGTFIGNAVYEGGFNVASHAHQHGNLLMKHLDVICQVITEPVIDMVDGELAAADAPVLALVK